jgi:hypothetical protein
VFLAPDRPQYRGGGATVRLLPSSSSSNPFASADSGGGVAPVSAPGNGNIFLDAISAGGRARTGAPNREQTTFERFFVGRMTAISPRTASDFFAQVRGQLTDGLSGAFRVHIVTQVSLFLAVNPDYVIPLIRSDFLSALELNKETLFAANLRILISCLSKVPSSITAEMVRSIAMWGHVREKAVMLVKFMSVFLAKPHDHPESFQILRIFLEDPKPYLVTGQYVHFVFKVFQNTRYDELRHLCFLALSQGLASDVYAVARASHAAFCQIDVNANDIPLIALLNSLTSGTLVSEGVAVLSRQHKLPSSRRLRDAFFSVGSASPLTVVCLMTMANEVKGAELFLDSCQWMNCLPLSDSFLLFLRICHYPTVREAITNMAELPSFLTRVASQGTNEELDATVLVIRRFNLSVRFIAALESAGFFETFFRRSDESESLVIKDDAALLVDKLARVAWIDSFASYIRMLPAVFAIGGTTAARAIIAALVLASHPDAQRSFVAANLIGRLAGCAVEPGCRPYKDTLLRYLTGL